jgi:O-acetyl-ADP-ribose deacetylase (regulator of RNase III)
MMAVRIVRGNLFMSDADVLVNPVNCLGVQGAGLARQFHDRYPVLDEAYRDACRSGLLRLGNPLLSEDGRVLWFPTKHHWRERSRLQDIDRGLQAFIEQWGEDPRSWAFPALGCGLGGLSWDQVRPLMEARLGEVQGEVLIYAPEKAPMHRR